MSMKYLIGICALVAASAAVARERGLPVFGDSFDAFGTFAENWVSKRCVSEDGVAKIKNGGSLRMRRGTPVEFVADADITVKRGEGVPDKKRVWGGIGIEGYHFSCQPTGTGFCVWRLPEDKRSSGKYVTVPGYSPGQPVRLRLVRKRVPGGVKYAFYLNGAAAGDFIAPVPKTKADGTTVSSLGFYGYSTDVTVDNFLLSTVRHDDDSPNMVFNSGFEHGEEGIPTYYGFYGAFNFADRPPEEYETRYLKRIAMDGTEKRSGKYSLRVLVNDASSSITIAPWQTGTVKGRPGVFSVWMKASTNGLPVDISFAPKHPDGHRRVFVTTEWKRYEVTRRELPGKGIYTPVHIRPVTPREQNAILWVDDLQAEIVALPPDGTFDPAKTYATPYKPSELDKDRFGPKKAPEVQQMIAARKLPAGVTPTTDFSTWTKYAYDGTRFWMKAVAPRVPTQAFVACDDDNLYLGFRNFGENPASLTRAHKERDRMLYMHDGLELFFRPDAEKGPYHFMTAANGDRFDSYANDIKWNGDWKTEARENKEKNAVDILVTIPFADFAPNGFSGRWQVNLCRNEYSQRDNPVHASTSKREKVEYRQPEFWPSLELPADVAAKWSEKTRATRVDGADTVLGRLDYYMNEPEAAWRVTHPDGRVTVARKPLAEIPMGTNAVSFTAGGKTYTDTVVRLPYRKGATQINRWARCVVKNGEKVLLTAPGLGCIGWFGYKPGRKTYKTLLDIVQRGGFTQALALISSRSPMQADARELLRQLRAHAIRYVNWCDFGIHNWDGYPPTARKDKRCDLKTRELYEMFKPYEDLFLSNLVIDEPELWTTSEVAREWLAYMKGHYPYLPVQMNNTVMGIPSRFADLKTDILMLDDYLTNDEGRTVDSVVRQVDVMREAPGGKPCWFFIVSHNATLHYKLPTYAEQIAQSWGCLCAGCSGIAWYFEIPVTEGSWRAMKQVNREAQDLKAVLLSEELCADASVDRPKSKLRHLTRTLNGQWYVLSCNIDAAPLGKTTFTLPKDAPRNGTVEVLYENRTLPLKDGVFTDTYPAHSRHLYRIK